MRVLLSMYGTRGGVDALAALTVRLRGIGAELRMRVPPDKKFAELLSGIDVDVLPSGRPMRPIMHGATLPSATELSWYHTELPAGQLDTLADATEGCDALAATGS
jgi:vancomycin aglycone glucosyltransferase